MKISRACSHFTQSFCSLNPENYSWNNGIEKRQPVLSFMVVLMGYPPSPWPFSNFIRPNHLTSVWGAVFQPFSLLLPAACGLLPAGSEGWGLGWVAW